LWRTGDPCYDSVVATEAASCALIIPALNEADSIGLVLAQVPPGLFSQIIVVDNGSRDSTAEVARASGAEVAWEPRRGYGRACLAGLARIRPGTTGVAIMDADLSDDPADLGPLIATLRSGRCDLAIGSR